ncbi:hypothetical protein JAAARDRAFT_47669 [Jaapia argillacea MUCL 33604]|uniref:G domain-containing protein n=1 Tax=Jaapia argillacea MUCL 33604 TaxID=933084 RepID=A0A067Q302_9AGAM|nr:hypothetical protein JAAARDRAFT_47669 [Jaapia argillacea MUCL 33604]
MSTTVAAEQPQGESSVTSDAPLEPTMNAITDTCSRFRVLIVGRSGVGKSSLINFAFGTKQAGVSDFHRGVASIDEEIISPGNDRFVLHDSEGYEPGEAENFNKLKNFIEKRTIETDVGKRLHAIWLCTPTPYAGGRVFEAGDDKIFDLDLHSVPVVIVFTKYDRLITSEEGEMMRGNVALDGATIVKKAKERASKTYKTVCVQQLKATFKGKGIPPYICVSVKDGYESTLQSLIKLTLKSMQFGDSSPAPSRFNVRDLFQRRPTPEQGPSSDDSISLIPAVIVGAAAQRVDMPSKITASIEYVTWSKSSFEADTLSQRWTEKFGSPLLNHKYWRGLASGAQFLGKTLEPCLQALHSDIVAVWNFSDVGPYLETMAFKANVSKVVQDLADPEIPNPNDALMDVTSKVASVMGAVTTFAHPGAVVVAPVVVGVLFAKWVYGVYKVTPSIVRCLMGYIVDLTIVMQRLFLLINPADSAPLTQVIVDSTLEGYDKSREKMEVHNQIREFVRDASIFRGMGKDRVFEQVVTLINKHSPRPQVSSS